MPHADADAQTPGEGSRQKLSPPPEGVADLIETREDLEALAGELSGSASVALDTEANSMHAYRERTCIVQVTAGGRSAIIDVLAVEDLHPLRTALDRSDVEVVMHGGDYDVTVLTRDHNFAFSRVFDTMLAATLLGDERVGLASLVFDHFGYTLNKRFQRADWARRPLSPQQLDYLRRDTMYLPLLREHYAERLEEADLTEEAEIEFRRLAERRGRAPAFDPEGWRRIKGTARLDARGRAVMRALFLWRERQAERRDLPPFKVLAPRTMLALAQQLPERVRDPRDLRVLGDRERRRHGRALVDVLRKALGQAAKGNVPARSGRKAGSDEGAVDAKRRRREEDRIRDWRRKEARRRGVPNMVVLPNPALVWLVQEKPKRIEQLEACRDIGAKRRDRYGEEILALLRG